MFESLLKRLFDSKPKYRLIAPIHPRRVIVAAACRDALQASLAPQIKSGHEGIVYLLGQTDGRTSLITSLARPRATTTPRSFHVDETAMYSIIESTNLAGLQVVGQLHTHPNKAYHSGGDVTGSLIRYDGFASIVLPDYGTRLPSLDGAAVYMYSTDNHNFVQLRETDLTVLSVFLQ